MVTINPKEIPATKLHGYLLSAITPRPIAFVSTVDNTGNVNLSPFSFFNCFGYNPPILVFSPARRGRDNTTKHTYENVLEVPEAVIHMVNYRMVQQMSLASTEYPKGVNEFMKAGFTEVSSDLVKPPRIAEAPVAMECIVKEINQTGSEGGAGNLVVCEVIRIHLQESVLDDEGRIDPFKLDAVARLGGDWYCRVQGDAIFKVPKPAQKLGIGIDRLPDSIRNSKVLTGNDLGMLGNVEDLPVEQSIQSFRNSIEVKMALKAGEDGLHRLAQEYLKAGKVEEAWSILLSNK
ncbi:MAG: flavin reductase family protein [Cyclobacteriaceae bacterium]|nr:flavin reductase family protein [Cyclobacteriaceae bacterium]